MITPATPTQIRTRRGISAAPREFRLILLMWQDADYRWWTIPGRWNDDTGGWVADAVTTGSPDLPAIPTHWSEML